MKLFFLFAFFFSFNALASVKCGEQTYTQEPVIRDGKFSAGVVAECSIEGAAGSDLRKVYSYFIATINKEGNIVHSEVPATLRGYPGTKYDVTLALDEGRLRNTNTIVSDDRDILINNSISSKVEFSGFAKFIKQLNVSITLSRVNGEVFLLRLENFTVVKKPPLVPTGSFFSVSRDQLLEQHKKKVQKLAESIQINL
ncbi:MAG TPA: hypothetical protein VNJ01_14040 [Bacteriovoracaceae bacterium]|nr:hypothetical protein [Bacteriovoracaceae bacterium]